jgi:3-phosphoglycerate kinase
MSYLSKKSVEDLQVAGKRVLVRCDFNVPLKNGVITDEKARNVVALYAALLTMGEKAGADAEDAVRNAGYVVYAYLGGQARRDITYTQEFEK